MRVLVKVYEAANDEGEDNGDKDYNLRHSSFPV
jgi:hypothetical protein